jgi:hypothetical protein
MGALDLLRALQPLQLRILGNANRGVGGTLMSTIPAPGLSTVRSAMFLSRVRFLSEVRQLWYDRIYARFGNYVGRAA